MWDFTTHKLSKFGVIMGLGMILMCYAETATAQSALLDRSVKVDAQTGTVIQLLDAVSKQSGISISYSPRFLNPTERIRWEGGRGRLGDVLSHILQNQPVEIVVRKQKIFLRPLKRKRRSRATSNTSEADKITLSGYVREKESGERIIGAGIAIPQLRTGTYTNNFGFYSLTLPKGNYALLCSAVGYGAANQQVDLHASKQLNFTLSDVFELEEVVIESSKESRVSEVPALNSQRIPLEKINSLPLLFGEQDVIRTTRLLPGVQSVGEGTNGLYVRGGSPDQNLILLDGFPLYNPSHLLGIVSVIHGGAIKRSNLITGGFPARYGGRLSSVMDLRMKDGNLQKLKAELQIGLLSGTLSMEGPLIKDKTSFNLSLRRTWLDALFVGLQKLAQEPRGQDLAQYNFYDINAKVKHRFSPNSTLYASLYLGDDGFTSSVRDISYHQNIELRWGNKLAALRWTRLWSPRLFSSASFSYTTYRYLFEDREQFFLPPDTTSFNSRSVYFSNSQIQDMGVSIDFDYYPHSNQQVKFGGGYINHSYNTNLAEWIDNRRAPIEPQEPIRDTTIWNRPDVSRPLSGFGRRSVAQELYIYGEDEISWKSGWKLNVGLHLASFFVPRKAYVSFQPRIRIGWQLSPRTSLSFAGSKMTQFVHILQRQGLRIPSDLWVPSTALVPPEHAWQGVGGFHYRLSKAKGIQLRLEAYYKYMYNLVAFEDGATFLSSSNAGSWEDQVEIGKGWAYGIETQLEKKTGKLTGWLAYTLAWSQRKFPNINQQKPFYFRNDRRHDLTLVMTYAPNKKKDLGLVWTYVSGNPTTIGFRRYKTSVLQNDLDFNKPQEAVYASPRNNYRLRSTHRLDLSINFHKQKKRGIRTWSFGVNNVYNRSNPYAVYLSEDFNTGGFTLKELSLFPILPYLSYRFKF